MATMKIEFKSEVTLKELKEAPRKYTEPSSEIATYTITNNDVHQARLLVIAVKQAINEGCMGLEISNPIQFYNIREFIKETIRTLPMYGDLEKVLILLTPVYEA